MPSGRMPSVSAIIRVIFFVTKQNVGTVANCQGQRGIVSPAHGGSEASRLPDRLDVAARQKCFKRFLLRRIGVGRQDFVPDQCGQSDIAAQQPMNEYEPVDFGEED